jgi:hypothetical protein
MVQMGLRNQSPVENFVRYCLYRLEVAIFETGKYEWPPEGTPARPIRSLWPKDGMAP